VVLETLSRPLQSIQIAFAQLRWWSGTQWRIAGTAFAIMLIAIGEVGQTLPPASASRVTPIEWWNYVTLMSNSALMGLIVGSFVSPRRDRVASASAGGFAAAAGAIVMACPFCSPLAIPLLGTGGLLAFLRDDRGWLALASMVVLGLTLALRLRASASCPVRFKPLAPAPSQQTH
jgi:hypothetical protein